MTNAQMEKVAAVIVHRQRINACKTLVKRAQEEAEEEKKIDYVARRKKLKLILGALLGTYVGARSGAAIGTVNGGKPGKGALIGSGLGALSGLGVAHLGNKVREYAGYDPMATTVSIAKT